MVAEYQALSLVTNEINFCRNLLSEISFHQRNPTLIYEDNQACITFAKNFICNNRSKHVDIKYHNARESVMNGKTTLEYCPTNLMIADLFAKSMEKNKFIDFRNSLGLVENIVVSGGEDAA